MTEQRNVSERTGCLEMNKPTSISSLIDMSVEDYKEYLKAVPDMGTLSGIKNLLDLEYQNVTRVKDELLGMKKSGEYKNGATPKQVDSSLGELYTALMVIEDRCTILLEEKKSRAIKPVKDC